MASLQCVFACGFLEYNLQKMLIHTLHKKTVSHQCVFACDFLQDTFEKMLIHKFYKKMVSFHCVFACVFLSWNYLKMLIYKLCKKMPQILTVFPYFFLNSEQWAIVDPLRSAVSGFLEFTFPVVLWNMNWGKHSHAKL